MWCPCDCYGCSGERCSGIYGCHYAQYKCIIRLPRKEYKMDWEKIGYKLIDAEWLAAKYPGTFTIPNAPAKAALNPNDFVKIFFEDALVPEFPERLWVQVDSWDLNYGGIGRIANVPYCITGLYGDTVKFMGKHILEIMKREEYNAKGGLQVPAVVTTRKLSLVATKPQLALTARVED